MRQPKSGTTLQASVPVQLLTAGTAACIADLVTFPLDTAKVRLQVIIFFCNYFLLITLLFHCHLND